LHPELQYFGSTSERFKGSAPNASVAPGPGTYAQRQRLVLKSDWSASERFAAQEGDNGSAPGPGSYNLTRSVGAVATASLLGSTGRLAFGSMEARRGPADVKAGAAPGPGTYALHTDFENGSDGASPAVGLHQRRLKRPVTERDLQQQERLRELRRREQPHPAPGAYDPVHSRDIAAVMRLPAKSEGFLSSADRASVRGERALASTSPGPGVYQANAGGITGGKRLGTFNRSVVEGAPRCGRLRGLGFESQSDRFGPDKPSGKMPGPGDYDVAHEWTKKTFNVNFGAV